MSAMLKTNQNVKKQKFWLKDLHTLVRIVQQVSQQILVARTIIVEYVSYTKLRSGANRVLVRV